MPQLRPAAPGDLDEVARIWRLGWADGHLGNVPEALVAVRTPESFRERAQEQIAQTIVATVDEHVVGFVMVVADEVEQVYVASASRGTGVAGVLLEEAERQVARNGHDRAWLAVAVGNDRARAFYERSGWTDEGRFGHAAPGPDGPIEVPCHRYVKAVG